MLKRWLDMPEQTGLKLLTKIGQYLLILDTTCKNNFRGQAPGHPFLKSNPPQYPLGYAPATRPTPLLLCSPLPLSLSLSLSLSPTRFDAFKDVIVSIVHNMLPILGEQPRHLGYRPVYVGFPYDLKVFPCSGWATGSLKVSRDTFHFPWKRKFSFFSL